MLHLGNHGPAVANMGGKHLQEHMLGFNTSTSIRTGEQRSADAVPQNNTARTGSHGHGQSASDEASNEEDDEDSSGEKDDEAEDPEVVAPPHGIGLGKGKRPVIRVEPAGDDESQEEMEGTSSRGVGQKTSNPVNQFLMRNKKRTFSNISNNSVLFGEDDDLPAETTFPRRKLARRLSTNSAKGLLTYLKDGELEATDNHANAVESSDDEEPEKTVDLDDEDYSGVNLISDESDMEQMEKQEEEWLINDAQQSADLFSDVRRLSLDSSASDNYFQPGIPISEDFFETTNQFPDVGFGQFFEPDVPPTSPEPAVSRKYSDSSTKRVRFDDEVNMSDSSSSSSSDWDTSWWPDLFEKDKLPPNLYQMIENEHDVNMDSDFPSSGSERSYWDFGQDDNGTRLQNDSDDYDDSESEPGSSGYETDMGDTTDEYDSDFASPPPQTPQQKSVLRRPSSAPGSRAVTPKPYQRSTRTGTGKFIPPVCGVFIHGDRNKAIAITNRNTKAVAFYRPRTTVTFRRNNFAAASSSTSTAQNSPRSTLQQLGAEDSDFHDAFNSPFPNSTDIMFTGIFGAAPNSDILALLNGSSVGPPEAFYPFVSVNENGTIAVLSDEDGFGTEDAEIDDDINLEDFMDFGPEGDETDVEQEDSTDTPTTPSTSLAAVPSSTPAHPPNDMTPSNRKRTASDVMLEHFDRGVVTAFRNNQNHYRSLARLPHDPDLRASVARPLRSGRSAETLMSPLRKRNVITKRMNGTVLAGISKASGKMDSRIMTSQHGPRAGTFS